MSDQWKIVPVEPTEEMKRAGLSERHDDLSRSIYKAMIEAAPSPPVVNVKSVAWLDLEQISHQATYATPMKVNHRQTEVVERSIADRLFEENTNLKTELTKARELFRDIADDPEMWTICSIALARRIDEQLAHQSAPAAKGGYCAVVKETLYDKGWRLAKEGQGLSNLWGNCADDSEMDEVYRGMKAYWNSVK